VTKFTSKGEKMVWTPKAGGRRVECLDCTVMALFCAGVEGVKYKSKLWWSRLKDKVQPENHDIFADELLEQAANYVPVPTSAPENVYIPGPK
jgi:phage terminase large subunit GpA-like protein